MEKNLFDHLFVNANYIKLLLFIKVVILLITIFLFIINSSNRLKISTRLNRLNRLNRYSNTQKNESDYYKGYNIKDINTFLTLNYNEILVEAIPNYSIIKPVFSIIVAFYNRKDTIKKAITSIQNQNFKSYEII